MDLTLREFENLNLYSNKNMEKVISKLVNESSNAAFINMFDDSLVLLDHDEGQFYTADYKFDESTLQLHLNNFEKVELVKEENDFREDVENFFEDEDFNTSQLTESYKENVMDQEKYVNELIGEAMSVKDFSDFVDYKLIKEAKENVELKSLNEDFVKEYQERLITNPLNEIKYIDWTNPIVVSLMETENEIIINTSVVEKAKDLWKKGDFKTSFLEAAASLIEEDEEAMSTLFEEYPSLFYLSDEDRETLFGKAIISSDLREQRKDINSKINNILENNEDILSLKERMLRQDGTGPHGQGAGPGEGKADGSGLKAKEITAEQAKNIAGDLKKIADSVEDEAVKEKIEAIIGKLDKTEEEGTDVKAVKEAISILSL
jgi:hypothetical protein